MTSLPYSSPAWGIEKAACSHIEEADGGIADLAYAKVSLTA